MCLVVVRAAFAAELLSKVICYAMDPVQDEGISVDSYVEGTSVDPVDEGMSVDVVSIDGSFVDIDCHDNSMVMEALDLSFAEDIGEDVSLFELSSSPLFSTIEDDGMEVESLMAFSFDSTYYAWMGINDAHYRIAYDSDNELDLSVFEDIGEDFSSFEPSSSPLFSTTDDDEMEVESSMALSFNSTCSAWLGINAELYRIVFATEDYIDLSVFEDIGEDVSLFELTSSPLFSTTEDDEIKVQRPMALSFNSSDSAWLHSTELPCTVMMRLWR